MRGLKRDDATCEASAYNCRAIRPAYEGIETELQLLGDIAVGSQVARSAPLMRGLKPVADGDALTEQPVMSRDPPRL